MTAIFVLGMHRSGTSLVSGLLRTLGVEFGPDSELIPPSQYNMKGFFEHVGLGGINVELLVKYGGDWYAPPVFLPGWEESEALADLRNRALERVEANFGGKELWGFKDPRTCLTFPFWRKILKDQVKVVVVGRNPIDSARSLQDVQKILASEASELWFKHMVAAFQGSVGIPRHVVFYEDFLEDLPGEMRRLGIFIDRPVSGEILFKAGQFVDAHLRHFQSSREDVQGGFGVDPRSRKAYLTIRAFVDVARQGKLEPEDEKEIERILGDIKG